ncbi:MAG: helix-turn-helix domain-containing protein [Pseudobdellovibrionaceae bacterium]
MNKKNLEARNKMRKELFDSINNKDIEISSALVKMRAVLNLSQQDFSKLVGISKKIISDIELNKGNPRVQTLNKIFAPLGLEVGLKAKTLKP